MRSGGVLAVHNDQSNARVSILISLINGSGSWWWVNDTYVSFSEPSGEVIVFNAGFAHSAGYNGPGTRWILSLAVMRYVSTGFYLFLAY